MDETIVAIRTAALHEATKIASLALPLNLVGSDQIAKRRAEIALMVAADFEYWIRYGKPKE